jgi:peptidoglycan/xylan/chitin deacetylase (PgdA/CDA1 family)
VIRRRRITGILAGILVIGVLVVFVKLVSGGGGGGRSPGRTHVVAAIAGRPIGSSRQAPKQVTTSAAQPTRVGPAKGAHGSGLKLASDGAPPAARAGAGAGVAQTARVDAAAGVGAVGGAGAAAASTTGSPAGSTGLAGAGGLGGLPSSAEVAAESGTGRPGSEAVPVLMYHVIAAPPPGAPFPGLYVTPDLFAAQMHALEQAGWHGVTLDQVRAYWTRGVPLPKGKPIVITFDNGYQSQYTQAFPVLRSIGWAADENLQLTGLPPSQGGFVAGQVKGLLAGGWELDTQGISHADLVTLSPSALRDQVVTGRTTLQRRYGVPVNWFCYPSGHYNAAVIAAVKAAGYVGSTTVVPGWAGPRSDPYRLPRLRVLGGTSASSLLAEVAAIKSDPAPPASYDPT